MTRVYHYDTTYEQEAADGTVTASVELRIYFTVTWGRDATRDEPGYGDTAEFHSAGVEIPPYGRPLQYRDLSPTSFGDGTLWDWCEVFVDDHQAELLEAAGHADEADREHAAEMRDEMRREVP